MLAVRLLIGGGGSFVVPGMSCAKVYSNVTQTITDNPVPPTAMTFTHAEHDPDLYWTVSDPTKLTIPAGMGSVPFFILGGSFTNDDVGVDCYLAIYKNGAVMRGGVHTSVHPEVPLNPGQPNGYVCPEPVLDVPVDGDYYELRCYIDQTGAGGGASMVFGHASAIDAQTWLGLVRLAT